MFCSYLWVFNLSYDQIRMTRKANSRTRAAVGLPSCPRVTNPLSQFGPLAKPRAYSFHWYAHILIIHTAFARLPYIVVLDRRSNLSMADEQLKLTEAHKRFRSVLTANILLSAINNKGHPLLKWKTTAPKNVTPSHLKHILTILVRNWNVIAAVAHVPQGCTPNPNAPDGGSSKPEPYQVNIIHNLPSSSPQQDGLASGIGGGGGNESLTNITAVANPDNKDTYFNNVDPNTSCVVVKSGESKFSLVTSANIWENVLTLPQ